MRQDTQAKHGFFGLNLLDFFIISLMGLAVLAAYFTVVRPVQFSHQIKREGVRAFAEVELILASDLQWLLHVLPVGEEKLDGYGVVIWKVLGIQEKEILPGKKRAVVTVKALVDTDPSSVIRHGKYAIKKGNRVFFFNNRYAFEGRVMGYRLLDEKVAI